MNLQSIKTFLILAQVKNFSMAARMLHIAQPAVTTQIRILEEELGFKLFSRSTRRVTLTTEGRCFAEKMRTWMSDLDTIIEETVDLHKNFTHHLSIGVVASATFAFLPAIISKFQDDNPKIRIRIVEGDPEDHHVMLEQQEIDVAVTRSSKLPKPFKTHKLFTDHLMLAAPVGLKNPLVYAKSAGVHGVFYIIDGAVARENHLCSLRQLEKMQLQRSQVILVGDYHSAMFAVKSGLGFALVPSCIKEHYDRKIAFVDLPNAETLDLFLAYRPDIKNPGRDFALFLKKYLLNEKK